MTNNIGFMKITEPKKMAKGWIVYSYQNEQEYLYFGAGPMSEILNFRQVIGNSRFSMDKEVTVVFHSVHNNKYEALAQIPNMVRTLNGGRLPIINKESGMLRGKEVMCMETGVTYTNARQACLMLDINPARMSQHLRKRPGFRTVEGGLTFEFVEKPCNTSSN